MSSQFFFRPLVLLLCSEESLNLGNTFVERTRYHRVRNVTDGKVVQNHALCAGAPLFSVAPAVLFERNVIIPVTNELMMTP